jgi:hypothetical protein
MSLNLKALFCIDLLPGQCESYNVQSRCGTRLSTAPFCFCYCIYHILIINTSVTRNYAKHLYLQQYFIVLLQFFFI